MKSSTTGIVKLICSFLTLFLVQTFFFKAFALIGIHFTKTAYDIMNLVKYILMALLVFIIYHSYIRAGQRSYNRHVLNNIIYSVSCFVFLMVVTILVHEGLKYLGFNVGFNFNNYFNKTFNLKFILNFISNCLIIPFLYCMVFPLGFSVIFKKCSIACIVAGVSYGIYYGISLHTNFETALLCSITPVLVTMLLTYLYKVNNNVWTCLCTYILYVLFGIFLLNYIM